MLFLVLLLVFAGVAAAIWFQGFWSGTIAFMNLLFAAMIATNLFEPISTMVESFGAASYTFLLDFIVLWFLFGAVYATLRGITDLISRTQVKFELPIEMGGRSLMAVLCGWLMTCFVAFSLHMAPLNAENPLGAWATPNSKSFLMTSPDRLWMRFMFDRSRGAFARGNFSGSAHPSDEALNVEAFDPRGEFALKYHERRKAFAAQSDLRVGAAASSETPAQ
jgi:hypothetical protein